MKTIREALADARKRLANGGEPSLVAFMLRDYQETKDAGLWGLAYDLGHDGGTSRQDVLGLIEYLEAYNAKNNAQ